MPWQYTPVTVVLVLVMLFGVAGAVLAWRQRDSRAELWGTLVQFAMAEWAFLMLLTVSSTSQEWQLFWLLLFLQAIPLQTVSSCGFVLHFIGRDEWLNRRRVALLFSYPVVTLLLAVTNGYHQLLVQEPALDTSGSWAVLTYDWGPAFWPMFALAYVIGAVYIWFLLRQCFRSRNVYRKMSFVLLVGSVLTFVVAVPSALQVSPLPHFLLVPHLNLVLNLTLILVTTSAKFARLVPTDRIATLLSRRSGNLVTLARDFVVEEVDNGIFVLDENDRIVDVNRTGKRMLGVERPVGKTFAEVSRPELVEEAGALEPMIAGEEPVRALEEEMWTLTGTGKRCYEVRISELGSGDVGHLVLMHDVTERKHREHELEEQKIELERQNERLDQFAGIVSHDLRNPLNTANGYLGITRDTGDLEHLDEIEHAHQRMEAIIDDALTLARQGKAITETEPVQLEALARDAWENVDTRAASLECMATLEFEGDRDRLLNVFENLFRNAVQHGAEDVTVSIGRTDEEPGFYVADDGPGIPEDELDEVLDHGYTSHSDGTGIGLSIVTDIVRGHGWEIAVSNGADGGARFDVTGVNLVAGPDDDAIESLYS